MPDSIHEHAAGLIAAALADGLTADERRALDAHLAACESCRTLHEELTATDAMLLQTFPDAVGPKPGFEARLVAGFRRRSERGGAGARLRSLLAWAARLPGARVAGAVAGLVVLVGLGQALSGRRMSSSATDILNDARIIDGRNSPIAVTLPGRHIDVSKFKGQPSVIVSPPETVLNSYDKLGDREGFINYGSPIVEATTGKKVLTPDVINQPVFSAPDLKGANTHAGNTTVNGGNLTFGAGSVSVDSLVEAKDQRHLSTDAKSKSVSEGFVGSVPIADINKGRDVSAGFGEVSIPLVSDGQRRTEPTGSFTGSDAPAAPHSADIFPKQYLGLAKFGDSSVPVNIDAEYQSAPGSPASPSPAGPQSAPSEPISPAPDTRKLIRNARAELEVASFEETVAALTTAAAQDGGFIDTQNSARGANGKLSGALVVKVLPENLDRFLARLRTLGEVKNQTIKTEDITKAYFDTEARLRNSRRMEERLLKMLEEVKGKMSEVLAVEKEIARVRGDIEEMAGELKLYDGQVRFATVSLSVYEKDLHQPAAFLLRETATLALAAGDVERAAAEARRLADAAHAQVLAADVQRDGAGHSTATLRLLLAPDAAPGVMAQLKALGRVENFDVKDERVAQNGADAANTGTLGPDTAKTERAPVSLSVTVRHDEQTSREVSLTVVAPDVGAAFDKARDAATAGGGEVLRAETARPQEGHARATLSVRMPARADGPLLDSLATLGRVSDRQTRRTDGREEGPVLVTLTLTDAEPAAQQTSVRVRTPEVERRLSEIKAHAAAAGATVESSTFAREGDGSEQGALTFRLPLGAYPAFADRVRALGEVKDFTVRRQDRPGDAGAPAEISLTLYREGRTVSEDAGVGATVRRTFGQGAGALMWSVQMIGVALAFLAPWAALAGMIGGAWWLWKRRRRS